MESRSDIGGSKRLPQGENTSIHQNEKMTALLNNVGRDIHLNENDFGHSCFMSKRKTRDLLMKKALEAREKFLDILMEDLINGGIPIFAEDVFDKGNLTNI